MHPSPIPLLIFFTLIAVIARLVRLKKHPALIAGTFLGGVLLLVASNFTFPLRIIGWANGISMLVVGCLFLRRFGIQRSALILAGSVSCAFAMAASFVAPQILKKSFVSEEQQVLIYTSMRLLMDAGYILFGVALIIFFTRSLRHYRLSP